MRMMSALYWTTPPGLPGVRQSRRNAMDLTRTVRGGDRRRPRHGRARGGPLGTWRARRGRRPGRPPSREGGRAGRWAGRRMRRRGRGQAVAGLAEHAAWAFGPVEAFVSNAGFTDDPGTGVAVSIDDIRHIVDVNLLAHVWAAKAVLPGMVERGHGYLVQTISSAALITGPSGMGYTLTKHGALGFAEWVVRNHGHQGIHVTCLCPNAVNTGMLGRDEDTETTGADPELLADARRRGGARALCPHDARSNGGWPLPRPAPSPRRRLVSCAC